MQTARERIGKPLGEAPAPSILLVDDRPANLLALEAMLEPLGHRLVTAANGEQALKKLLAEDFALILLDVQMPGMDGLETASLIKSHARTANLPIIFISAINRDSTHVFSGYAHGAVDYLLKPLDPDILRAKVSVFVDLYLKGEKIKAQAKRLREQEVEMIERRSEERYRKLSEVMPVPMWASKRNGVVYYRNQRLGELVGPAVTGETIALLHAVHPEDVERVTAGWRRALAEEPSFEMEYRLRRTTDGAYRWHLVRGVAEGTAQEGGFIAVATDIEEKKQAEALRERLLTREQQAREAAENANRSKDEFLATVSHELRTPLNAILGWTQLLRQGELEEEEVSHALETIQRNAQAQARLIADLLDVARIVAGKLRLELRATDMRSVVAAAVDSVRPAADKRSVTIDVVTEGNDLRAVGDASRLQQVVWNLLSNAVKFGRAGGRVEVRIARSEAYLEISVKDDGQGIAAEFLPRVFDRFRQADSRSTRVYGGLGLGLAIVRHLVELHGGRVSAESDGPGRGATFRVVLPFESPATRAGANNDFVDTGPDLRGVRVLVVDDEVDAREVLGALLERCGAEVTLAASAEEALSAVEKQTPHVLLSDIGMPGGDGLTLLRRARAAAEKRGDELPALAITAFARDDDRTRILRAGFQQYMAKPVDPDELPLVVAGLARRSAGG